MDHLLGSIANPAHPRSHHSRDHHRLCCPIEYEEIQGADMTRAARPRPMQLRRAPGRRRPQKEEAAGIVKHAIRRAVGGCRTLPAPAVVASSGGTAYTPRPLPLRCSSMAYGATAKQCRREIRRGQGASQTPLLYGAVSSFSDRQQQDLGKKTLRVYECNHVEPIGAWPKEDKVPCAPSRTTWARHRPRPCR